MNTSIANPLLYDSECLFRMSLDNPKSEFFNPEIKNKRNKEFIEKILSLFRKNYKQVNYHRLQLASDMAMSEKQLQRRLKSIINKNPMQYFKEFRLFKAKEKLKFGYRVSEVSYDCGFSSASYFSFCFKEFFGMAPKKFQQTALKVLF